MELNGGETGGVVDKKKWSLGDHELKWHDSR